MSRFGDSLRECLQDIANGRQPSASALQRVQESANVLDAVTGWIAPDGALQVRLARFQDVYIPAGEMRIGEGNPDDSSNPFTGTRIAYPALTYDGRTWHLVGVEENILKVGIRATDGEFLAAGGDYILNENGQEIEGIDFLSNHTATNTVGEVDYTRRFRQGFQLLTGHNAPVYSLEYFDDADASNLMITGNPDFEDGDLSGWTADASSWVIYSYTGGSAPVPYAGTYCALVSGVKTDKGLESDAYEVTPGTAYRFSVYAMAKNGATRDLRLYARWYDAEDDLVQSDLIGQVTTSNSAWLHKSAALTAPATAATATIDALFTSTDDGSTTPYAGIDSASIELISDYGGLGFTPYPGTINSPFHLAPLSASPSAPADGWLIYALSDGVYVQDAEGNETQIA